MTNELHWLSASELAAKIRGGELSAREALQAHWDRIDTVNAAINAVVYEDRDASWQAASAADERQAAGDELPPLHGVPITNKDTNDTAGMPSTWGSPLLRNAVPSGDSLIVKRLRAAGAIMNGKNNVPEFAAGGHSFNEVYGVTRNPYDLSRSAGGSSGGAAAAIAAGIQAIGDGSDMGGSLRIPASFCNVYGLRPSRGRVPSPGPNSWAWLGRTGPMAREVCDLTLMMNVLSGPDRSSPTSILKQNVDFFAGLDAGLSGLRIGWAPDSGLGLPFDPAAVAVVEQAVRALEAGGATVELAHPDIAEADFVFEQTRAFDFEMAWGELVRGTPDLVKPEMLENVALGTHQTAAALRALALARTRLEGEVRSYFDRYDLWITPTTQSAPFPVEWRFPEQINGTATPGYLDWMRSVCVVSAMDVPVISVPAGFTPAGLPVGMQISAKHGAEGLLLRVARAYEQLQPWARTRPALVTEPAQ